MIRDPPGEEAPHVRKPRASGDDPELMERLGHKGK